MCTQLRPYVMQLTTVLSLPKAQYHTARLITRSLAAVPACRAPIADARLCVAAAVPSDP